MDPTGELADGTSYVGQVGVLAYDPDADRVQCHLCGRWLRALPAHLVLKHDWRPDAYREAFGLLRGQPLQAAGVSDRQRALARARYQHDPRVADALGRADELRAQGVLQAAVRATAGRDQPLAKRRIHADASRRGARARLKQRNARLEQRARELGFADLSAYLQARAIDQWQPAPAIGAELRIGADTVRSLLAARVPARAGDADRRTGAAHYWQGYRNRAEAHATARAAELGYPDLAACLRDRYVVREGSFSDLQELLEVSRRTVGRLLRAYGIGPAS
jgi:hypothetical protein